MARRCLELSFRGGQKQTKVSNSQNIDYGLIAANSPKKNPNRIKTRRRRPESMTITNEPTTPPNLTGWNLILEITFTPWCRARLRLRAICHLFCANRRPGSIGCEMFTILGVIGANLMSYAPDPARFVTVITWKQYVVMRWDAIWGWMCLDWIGVGNVW